MLLQRLYNGICYNVSATASCHNVSTTAYVTTPLQRHLLTTSLQRHLLQRLYNGILLQRLYNGIWKCSFSIFLFKHDNIHDILRLRLPGFKVSVHLRETVIEKETCDRHGLIMYYGSLKESPHHALKKKRKKLKELEKGIKMCFNKELAPRF